LELRLGGIEFSRHSDGAITITRMYLEVVDRQPPLVIVVDPSHDHTAAEPLWRPVRRPFTWFGGDASAAAAAAHSAAPAAAAPAAAAPAAARTATAARTAAARTAAGPYGRGGARGSGGEEDHGSGPDLDGQGHHY